MFKDSNGFSKRGFVQNIIREIPSLIDKENGNKLREVVMARFNALPIAERKGVEMRPKDIINGAHFLRTVKNELKERNTNGQHKPLIASAPQSPESYTFEELTAAKKYLDACGDSVTKAERLLKVITSLFPG